VGPADDGDDELPEHDPERERTRQANRTFWDRVIATIRFSHPDQMAPRHGGQNWVRVPTPDLPLGMTLFRMADQVGAFVDLTGDAQEADFERLREDRATLESEIGEQIRFTLPPDSPRFRLSVGKRLDTKDPSTVPTQLDWLCGVDDRLVTAMRTGFSAHTSRPGWAGRGSGSPATGHPCPGSSFKRSFTGSRPSCRIRPTPCGGSSSSSRHPSGTPSARSASTTASSTPWPHCSRSPDPRLREDSCPLSLCLRAASSSPPRGRRSR
jgi:hypothetical protein